MLIYMKLNRQEVKIMHKNITGLTFKVIKANSRLSILMALMILMAILTSLISPLILEAIVDQLTMYHEVALILILFYFISLAAAGLFEAAQNGTITIFGQKMTHAIRSQMAEKLNCLPASYFTIHESGKITSIFVNDVDAVDSLFTNGILSMFADSLKLVSILFIIFTKSKGLGILMLILTPCLFWMTRIFQKRILKAQIDNRKAIGRVNNHIPETIRNIRMIHTLFKQNYMEKRYDEYIQDSYHAQEKSNFYDSLYSPIIIFISSCVIAILMVFAAMGEAYQTFFGMSVGSAVAIIAYVGKVFGPLESIGMEIQNIQSAAAGIARMNAFLDEKEKSFYPSSIICAEPSIKFEDVSFGYNPDKKILNHFSFQVNHGEYATLVGRTGAGKSTILKLLLGLYEPDEGKVTICGRNVLAISDQEKRKVFGYVEQSFRAVNGTIKDQITLYDLNLKEDQVIRAAQLVGIDEAIQKLEKGYETDIKNAAFSQGQLQLLSIARAIVYDPMILLLDEITANLDSQTEKRVMDALENASRNRTVLSISHRLYEKTMSGKLIEIK